MLLREGQCIRRDGDEYGQPQTLNFSFMIPQIGVVLHSMHFIGITLLKIHDLDGSACDNGLMEKCD